MKKALLGFAVMFLVIIGLSAIGGFVLGALTGGNVPEVVYTFFSVIYMFTGYLVSLRFVVQSRAAAPASLNNSTNSECKS